ncbi:protein QUIRKY [Cinnamomum micranthum f. kanehirae]|uniref:Protein QUIRKY n=1 Tax=Cinnamomum micranthum f. kanehirae TaxID=337451 RepID=A0A3S4P477_9MAGN|nr:protein QUIRKY [Cinnamomum micranthum f. kanehirae]
MKRVRKLIVEVVEAKDLRPKDGHGTSSPYVVVDFNGQRKKTRPAYRDLNPAWNEVFEFQIDGSADLTNEVLEIDMFHDRRPEPRGNIFLGRLRLNSSQFVREDEAALIFYPLEKKNFFSWVRGEIGLKIYYVNEVADSGSCGGENSPAAVEGGKSGGPTREAGGETDAPAAPAIEENQTPPIDATANVEKPDTPAAPPPPPPNAESTPPVDPPPEDAPKTDETVSPPPPPAEEVAATEPPPPILESAAAPVEAASPPQPAEPPQPPPAGPPKADTETVPKWGPQGNTPGFNPQEAVFRRRPADVYPRDGHQPERFSNERSSYDLVEKMHYLFIRIVKARSLPSSSNPFVKISVSGTNVRSKSARKTAIFEWDQTFAFGGDAHESGSTLEVSVWDPQPFSSGPPPGPDAAETGCGDNFLGGICFDVSEIPLRDPPDSPLAPQWYRLEGGGAHRGDLMLATWIGTQADESFSDAWKTDTNGSANSRSKVYLSPKLWYLRATIIEAQDLSPLTPLKDPLFSVRAQLGFQSQKTRNATSRNGSPSWNEDVIFVAAEPFGDQHLLLSLENRLGKEATVLGTAAILLVTIERRVDDMKVVSRWFDLQNPVKSVYNGRLHVRVCFDGGYHVSDEPAHMTSDFRPTARQLWKPPVGTVELGILGCRNLLPVKTVAGKGTADPYAVAKYGEKWVRSRTVTNSLEPKWNEQYTWQVYDPCTVLTVGVFDSVDDTKDVTKDATRPDFRIGKVRIRISTLESNTVYRGSYPLLLMLPTGVRKMGEIELAVRFARASSTLDVLHVYTQPMLPRMHHLKPIGTFQQEALRQAAARVVAQHLARTEPPLRREVVLHVLDADTCGFSMRRVRANWVRIMSLVARAVDLVRWIEDTRWWRNPTVTMIVHVLLVLLVWHPDLVCPTVAFYVFGVGAWKRRVRARVLSPHPCTKMSQAENADRDELDEEFDPIPSIRGPEVVRARYDRLRMLGARVQTVLGDLAMQGERVQALVTWRDPRATGMFIGFCFLVSVMMYLVPTKMVAVVGGFYYLRHPLFRDRMPSPGRNFFKRLPSLSDRMM